MRAIVIGATVLAVLVGLASLQLLSGVARRFPLEHRSRRPLGRPARRRGRVPAELAQLERLADDALRGDRVVLAELDAMVSRVRSSVSTTVPHDDEPPRSAVEIIRRLDRLEAALGLPPVAPPTSAAPLGGPRAGGRRRR